MTQKLTISKVALQNDMSVPNIRFYEAKGIIPHRIGQTAGIDSTHRTMSAACD